MIRKGDIVRGISEPLKRLTLRPDGCFAWAHEGTPHKFEGIVTLVRRRLGTMYWCLTTEGEEVRVRDDSIELVTDEKEAEEIKYRCLVELPSEWSSEKAERNEAKEKIRKAKRRVVKLKAVMAKQKIFKEEA